MSVWTSVRSFEPAYIAHITSVMITAVHVQDFIQEKVCRVNLAYGSQICDALLVSKNQDNKYSMEQKEVHKLTAMVLMVKTIIENAFPLLLVFLMGPWSDKYGRKLPLLIVISGFFFANLILATFAYGQSEIPPGSGVGAWTIALASSFVVSLSGSQNCFMMAAFSYVMESVSFSKMSMRMGITHSCFLLALFAGFGGGGLLTRRGFTMFHIFLLSLCLEAFAFLYLFFMMKNQKAQSENIESESTFQIIKSLFEFQHVKESVDSIFKERAGNKRLKLWLLLTIHSCTVMPMFGEFNVWYLFVQNKFHWDAQDFGIYVSYKTIVGFLSNFFTTWFLIYLLGFADHINGIIACFSRIFANLVVVLAKTPQILYIGPITGMLSGPAFTIPRTQISKLVSSSELGKVNSFIASLECVLFLVASPIYTFAYSLVQDSYPSSVFLISAGLMVPQIVIYCWLYYQPKDADADNHVD